MITLQRTIPSLFSPAVSRAIAKCFPALVNSIPSAASGVALSKRNLPCDYQTSAALAIARQVKKSPEWVATELSSWIRQELVVEQLPATLDTSKNGFLNITLDDSWVADEIRSVSTQGLLHRAETKDDIPASRRVLVDYASPNMGKELHPGHLRSAVIGDSLARGLAASGWDVDRVSHVGDAGLPVAIVLSWYL